MQDPNLELVPDFLSAAYLPIRNAMAQGLNITPEAAAEQLLAAWNAERETRIIQWNNLVAQQLQAEQLHTQQEREAEEARLEEAQRLIEEAERVAEAEHKEAEKKKPKIGDFDENCLADDVILPRPAPFAINKLKTLDYVELAYFTPEGCAQAAEESRAVADEAYGLTQIDGHIAFKPLAAVRASKNITQDKDLTWRQMTMGKNEMLAYMAKLDWPKKHLEALANFFFNLEDHPLRRQAHGDNILILFQAKVRREWHDSLDHGQGFNIGKINPATLRDIQDEYMNKLRIEGLQEVCVFPLRHPKSALIVLCSLSPLFYSPLNSPYASCLVCLMPHMLHA